MNITDKSGFIPHACKGDPDGSGALPPPFTV